MSLPDRPRRIAGRAHDLGDGMMVHRLLPTLETRRVGPFVFFDHLAPASFVPGRGMDVRPHPHIGLSTLTWLFEGAIRHRDSLGSVADIRPGEVNWMTAGRGIAHSERTPPAERAAGQRLHGLQFWLALPQAQAECAPAFEHRGADELPRLAFAGVSLVLAVGSGWAARSPVRCFAPTFLAEARLAPGAALAWPAEHVERGLFVVEGAVDWDGLALASGGFAVAGGGAADIVARTAARVVLFGGAPLDGERQLWWNFVAATPQRIEQAKADWLAGRFGRVPGDETEFIPLPDTLGR